MVRVVEQSRRTRVHPAFQSRFGMLAGNRFCLTLASIDTFGGHARDQRTGTDIDTVDIDVGAALRVRRLAAECIGVEIDQLRARQRSRAVAEDRYHSVITDSFGFRLAVERDLYNSFIAIRYQRRYDLARSAAFAH